MIFIRQKITPTICFKISLDRVVSITEKKKKGKRKDGMSY
jgi:hypothetical protein